MNTDNKLHHSIRQLSPQLQSYLRSRVHRPQDRADLYQQTIMALLSHTSPDKLRNPLAYAITVARHLVFHHSKSNHTKTELADEYNELECTDPTSDPEAQCVLQQQVQHMEQVLLLLPPLRREVFIRCRLHHQPRAEIALELNMTEAALKKHISRAVAQLAHCRQLF
ncbi:RNA polymerase sigma factor [Rheinheimera sp. 1928-s]|uniref:RNA polymerase sigma factor n=1 Tax=Rheinheimera sp. 1928-s TaxID=3033803 RepID=UPI00260C26A7|nr:RNA polymerase sigma factor [Rheinheimera sp. 1928-s]MDF3124767.1 RNA polymerase sigma factor [Rheinheimera sp. 1928-s]